MLSRRNLRVKVMQTLYAIEYNNQTAPAEAARMLEKSIEKSYSLVIYNLALIVRVAAQISKEANVKSSKHLPTEKDLRFSTKLTRNPYISIISNDNRVKSRLRLTVTDDEETLIREIFKKLSVEKEYQQYCDSADSDESQKQIIAFLHGNIILKNPSYLQYVEDNFPECVSEISKMNFAITDLLEKLSPSANDQQLVFADSKAEEAFARELLEKTIAGNERFSALIQPKLKNWDIDRIARLDMILMKMALCELLNFEQIPVKVSINEYIDISKNYSTPKSKDFINGILDNIMHELRQSNEIRKTGRGLVE